MIKTVRFINKNYSRFNVSNYPVFKFSKIYFETNFNYYILSIELAKKIFIKRYFFKKIENFDIENLYNKYFDVDIFEITKEDITKENNELFVSSFQILFDKLYYIDFYNNKNLN